MRRLALTWTRRPWRAASVLARQHSSRADALAREHARTAALLKEGRAEEAERRCRELVARHRGSVAGTLLWGDALATLGRAGEAAQRYEEGLEAARGAGGRDSGAAGHACLKLAGALHADDRLAAALDKYREAIRVFRRLRNGPGLGSALASAASAYAQAREFGRAAELFEEAVPLLEDAHGRDHPAVEAALAHMAACLDEHGAADGAAAAFGRAADALRRMHGVSRPGRLGAALEGAARNHARAGRFSEALERWAEALPLLRRAFRDAHESVAGTLANMAGAAAEASDGARAAELALEALPLVRASFPDEPARALALAATGARAAAAARLAGPAAALYAAAVEAATEARGPDDNATTAVKAEAARALTVLGNPERGAELLREVAATRGRVHGAESVEVVHSLWALHTVLRSGGDTQGARETLERAAAMAAVCGRRGREPARKIAEALQSLDP